MRTHFETDRHKTAAIHEPGSELSRRTIVALFAYANAAALLSGCSGEGTRAAPVDPSLARNSLVSVLESWKKGDKPEAAQSSDPPIVVQDLDWSQGAVLVEFDISGDGKNDDANLRIPVTLTLKQRDGKAVKRQVTYLVGTSPSITVFREFP